MSNILKIAFLTSMGLMMFLNNGVDAKQILPENIQKITTTISAPLSGEKGKLYFICSSGQKCTTEDAVKDYYQPAIRMRVIRNICKVFIFSTFKVLAFFTDFIITSKYRLL